MRVKLFPSILVCLLCAFACSAQAVDEAGSSAIISGTNAEITLLANSTARAFDGSADLQLIDPQGVVRAKTSHSLRIKTGIQKYRIDVPLGDLVNIRGDELGWFRLRYRLGESAGIISLSELMHDVFELRVAAAERLVTGTDYRVRVRAINPFTKAAVKKVSIEGKLVLDVVAGSNREEINVAATGITNGDGLATLQFKIPPGIRFDGDPEFEIVGRKHGVVRKIDDDIESDERRTSVFFTADKPMYQPGETFNLRGLFLDPNNTVVPGQDFELTIEDEDDTQLFSQTVKTSEYGIASISWKIPDDAKLGRYEVELDGDEYFHFNVTRYDLPNFVVSAEADKKFYLTTERSANITVSADYLFGKPVSSGIVRVVREDERRWSWERQKYDVDEGVSVDGETNGDGKYTAKIDLTDEIDKLEKAEWMRFVDLHFAAYFTDASTNRTEQKRIDLRITKEPIHVYFITYSDQNSGLPMIGYVSTFYADGTPAMCSVEFTHRNSTLDSIKTNSFGAGKFRFAIPQDAPHDQKFDLRIVARDKRGQRGIFREGIELTKNDAIYLETDKAVYKSGETIRVGLASTVRSGLVYIDLVKDNVVLESRNVELRNGKAELLFAYSQKFKGALTVAAFTDTNRGYWDPQMRFSRGVIFPQQQDFRLDAKFSRKTYAPGDDAKVNFSVSNGSRTVESALGITIFDKAIEERARTDGEFRDYFGGFASLMGLDRAFGNITLRDLGNIDTSNPVSDEMQLAAEVILAGSYHRTNIYHTEFDAEDVHTTYSAFFEKQIKPMEKILRERFEKDYLFPDDTESFLRIVQAGGTDPDQIRDPWGKKYKPSFGVERSLIVFTLDCSGPDKLFGTPDDFVVLRSRFPYFTKIAHEIDRAVNDEYLATGRHPRDVANLTEILKRRGVDPVVLVDRWKRPYRISFGVSGRSYVITISSLGPDGIQAETRWGGDDFDVANIHTDYFSKTESEINLILARAMNAGKREFPEKVVEFKALVREGGLDFDSLRDAHGEPVYIVPETRKQYVSEQAVENGRTVSRAVGRETLVFSVRTTGPDKADKSDDYTLASFSKITTEFYAHLDSSGRSEITTSETSSAKGAIRGTIMDPNGAVVPGVEVIAVDESDATRVYVAMSNDEGVFLLANLPSGKYTIAVTANHGFAAYRRENVSVRSQVLVNMDIELNVSGTTAMVEVVSAAVVDQSSNSSVTNVTRSRGAKIVFPYLEQTSTPRLREYFPETLLWRPELITDRRGRAELNFKVADNITTWKMYAIASTKDGKVGVAEKEFTAFQPFFVDLDPPKFLTEGDRISLPVQVRNYTDAKQSVDVSMEKADWFSFAGADRQSIDVDAGGSKNAIFAFRANAPIKGGKQRVTATARKESDAIEKPVTVRQNGQEIVRTQSKLFQGIETFKLDYPANALGGTARAEVKIYPNLFSHVAESVEGLLQRPYGCGEQTISSTYPNVMILKFVKTDTPLRRTAQKYLQKGYERLIGYQVGDGGFTYWGGKDASNIALTAYALRFLNDAKEFIDVDDDVVRRAEDFLVRVQTADGSWPSKYGSGPVEIGRSAMTTAYVVRSMAMRKTGEKTSAMQKAFTYLDAHRAEITESYTLALFGLALLDAGDTTGARGIANRLAKAGAADADAMFWNLDTSTLFYGWGTTGRIETTALVVQLLTRTGGADVAASGTLYLLKNKDRYGVWYSTQTTINVLDAFLATLSGAKGESSTQPIEVFLNGQSVQSIAVDGSSVVPVRIDLSDKLNTLSNALEVRGATGIPVMVQTVATHYISWRDVPPDTKSPIVLNYTCDKTEAAIMNEINCSVESGTRSPGYGMFLAEIGLPPGADVSREMLDRATRADSGISRYDILPDRIVVYFWSRPGGTKFNFSFRPRYGIDAQTPPSVVYDYYNPESQATVAPLRFSIR
ncbi:MAG: alpha-2-macroglobulin family protein [Acidobacteriota bacterium]